MTPIHLHCFQVVNNPFSLHEHINMIGNWKTHSFLMPFSLLSGKNAYLKNTLECLVFKKHPSSGFFFDEPMGMKVKSEPLAYMLLKHYHPKPYIFSRSIVKVKHTEKLWIKTSQQLTVVRPIHGPLFVFLYSSEYKKRQCIGLDCGESRWLKHYWNQRSMCVCSIFGVKWKSNQLLDILLSRKREFTPW